MSPHYRSGDRGVLHLSVRCPHLRRAKRIKVVWMERRDPWCCRTCHGDVYDVTSRLFTVNADA